MKHTVYYWLFGRFEGQYQEQEGAIVLTSGRLLSAQSTYEMPLPSAQDEITQATPLLTDVTFGGASSASEKLLLTDITVRQYTTYSKDSQQHIEGLFWARISATKKPWLNPMQLGLLGLLLLLGLNFCTDRSSPPAAKEGTQHQAAPAAQLSGDGQAVGLQLATCDTPLQIDADVLFDFNRDTLKPEAHITLKQMAPFLETVNAAGNSITIVGHTDSFGSQRYNQQLSQRRADRVALWLVEQGLIEGYQVRAEGRGETALIADGLGDQQEQAANRRVEVVLNCSTGGIPVVLLGDEPVFLSSQPLAPIPEGITIDDALIEPELFFDSCDQSLLLNTDLLFDFDRASLKASAISELERVGTLLKTNGVANITLSIDGHTDSKGSEQHNLRLSQRRALRVARWLTRNTPIAQEQLVIAGKGESSPIVQANATAQEQQRNRRVEIAMLCSATPINQAK